MIDVFEAKHPDGTPIDVYIGTDHEGAHIEMRIGLDGTPVRLTPDQARGAAESFDRVVEYTECRNWSWAMMMINRDKRVRRRAWPRGRSIGKETTITDESLRALDFAAEDWTVSDE